MALVPLLWAWRDAGPARAALYGFLAGFAFFGVLLLWAWYFGIIAFFGLIPMQAGYWAVAGALVGALHRYLRVSSPFLTAAVWVLLESMRGVVPLGGFAWGEVGVALHDIPVARALASWGGVLLVSFLVVAWNGLLVDAALAWRRARVGEGPGDTRRGRGRWRGLELAVIGLVAIVAVSALADIVRFTPTSTGTLRYALLQGNDQDRRLTQSEIDTQYLTRQHLALAERLRGRYDLIVFPESSLSTDPEADPALRAEITALARKHRSSVLVNVLNRVDTPGKLYNSNRLYDADGTLQATYSKRHLVPFGEYVPWRDQLSFIGELQQIPEDQSPGDRDVIFDVRGHPLASVICFESAFGPQVRRNVGKGAQLIVVSTNNRSYRRSANSAQHLALSQMRAAETARPVLQASISGISAVIDAGGDIRTTTSLFHNTIVSGDITLQSGQTPYVRYGDWVQWGSLLVVAGAVVLGLRRRRLLGRPGATPHEPTQPASTPA